MSLHSYLNAQIGSIINQQWDMRDGYVVPATQNIKLTGGGVKLQATFLYADLARSTELAMNFDPRIAAKISRSFLAMCTSIIRKHKGKIRSFDGDRVMGIFVGASKDTLAVTTGLEIHYAFRKILKPRFNVKYPDLIGFDLSYGVGIDTSSVLAVRGGIRDNSDLVWIGRAPNIAAKLSSIREEPFHTIITADVYDHLEATAKFSSDSGTLMWQEFSWSTGLVNPVYASSWMRKP